MYCIVPPDYTARCLEVDNNRDITTAIYPLHMVPQIRPFCGKCPDSYNSLTVNISASPYFVIPDVGSLNVLRAGQWFRWMIGNCDPFVLYSVETQIYVLCRFVSTDRQVVVYTINLEANQTTAPSVVTIAISISIQSNASAFFMKDGEVRLCIVGDSHLLFYNFLKGVSADSPLPLSSCPFVGQLTAFEGINGNTYILVECTSGNASHAVISTQVYDTESAEFTSTPLLGSHDLGKNVLSPNGSVIASWRGATCVFSHLEDKSTIPVPFKGAIHSAILLTIGNSLVYVAAVTGPSKGLYWVNVSLALTGNELGLPQFIDGSTAVCMTQQCSGIVSTGSEFVMTAVEDGTQVKFFSLFNNSHFGPIDIRVVVARIGVISSGELTHPDDGYLPPRIPIAETYGLSFGIPALPVLGTIIIIVAFGVLWRYCKRKRYV